MHVDVTTAELVQALINRARKKFWSLKHVLKARGRLQERLNTLTKTVGGALLWCCGALIPDPVGIHMVNKFQASCVAWMMGVKRQDGEQGVCHGIRCIRLARAMIQKGGQRWGTTWLERAWTFLGHVARGQHRDFPLSSTLHKDEFVQRLALVGFPTAVCDRFKTSRTSLSPPYQFRKKT